MTWRRKAGSQDISNNDIDYVEWDQLGPPAR